MPQTILPQATVTNMDQSNGCRLHLWRHRSQSLGVVATLIHGCNILIFDGYSIVAIVLLRSMDIITIYTTEDLTITTNICVQIQLVVGS